MLKWLSCYGNCHICLEATGSYSISLATFLADNGINISVENPTRIHAFGQSELSRNKTDQGDAKMIARYCALHTPALWSPAPLSERQLTALVRYLSNLEEMKRMQENRQLVADEVIRSSLTNIIAYLKQQIKETKQKIRTHIDNNHNLKKNKQLLESIPGIGEIVSSSLLGISADATTIGTRPLDNVGCGYYLRHLNSAEVLTPLSRATLDSESPGW